MLEPEFVGDSKKKVSSRHKRDDANLKSRRLGKLIQDLHKFNRDMIPAERREADTEPHH